MSGVTVEVDEKLNARSFFFEGWKEVVEEERRFRGEVAGEGGVGAGVGASVGEARGTVVESRGATLSIGDVS